MAAKGRTLDLQKATELDAFRVRIEAKFEQLSQAINALRQPKTNNGTQPTLSQHVLPDLVSDIQGMGVEGLGTMAEVAKLAVTGEPWDDKDYLLERLVYAVSEMPLDTIGRTKVSARLVNQLWNDLQHPPQSYLGTKFAYRSADGSNNSLLYPHLGAANTPYARTCIPLRPQNRSLPDPGVIFDAIMAREKEEDHPNKISSMLFYMASIIIHDLFRTDHTDSSNSKTSSYLDLSPLYGSNQEEQNMIRSFKDGALKPDCFSEKRLLGFPPGVAALLIMFNRFHNHVVRSLALINEGGRFTPPKSKDPEAKRKRDENLFQTGRLVTCGLYINIILIDYVRTILNLNRTNSNWFLDPRQGVADSPPFGTGNQVSAEFNLVYRWHSCISARDSKWTECLYAKLFPGKRYEEVDFHDLMKRLSILEKETPINPSSRSLADMQGQEIKRDKEGKFPDDDLVELLSASIEDCAGAFGARRIPKVMRSVEILGMEQARTWNLATLNEFRAHFKLKKYTTFEEINPDIANELKNLYEEPDNVELYPDLVCESTKKPMFPGSGLTPPYTTSRAILSDAVSLVRGDRFYTIDWHPKAVTNWGFAAASSDLAVDNGCVIHKLFHAAFSNHYTSNSVYAHYPFTIPSEMKLILIRLGKAGVYDFTRPGRLDSQVLIYTHAAATSIMEDEKLFKPIHYSLEQSHRHLNEALLPDRDRWEADVKAFYESKTRQLLSERAYKLAGFNQIDIIRDLGNIVQIHFCAALFGLPLRTIVHPHALFTEKEMYLVMSAIFTCAVPSWDCQDSPCVDPVNQARSRSLGVVMEAIVDIIKATGITSEVSMCREENPLSHYGIHIINYFLAAGMPVKDLVWGQILATCASIICTQSQLFVQALEFYLLVSSGGENQYLSEITEAVQLDTVQADEDLLGYLLEGWRSNCNSKIFRKTAQDCSIADIAGKDIAIPAGTTVCINLREVLLDPLAFPDPMTVFLDRPLASYFQVYDGSRSALGLYTSCTAMSAVFKTVFRLKNLRPAKGPQGRISKVPAQLEGYWQYLNEKSDDYSAVPCSLTVNWDD